MKHRMETDGTGSHVSKQHRADKQRECIQGRTTWPSKEENFAVRNEFVGATALRAGRRMELRLFAWDSQHTDESRCLHAKLFVHLMHARGSDGDGAKRPRIAYARMVLEGVLLARSHLPRISRFVQARRSYALCFYVSMQESWVGCGA